MGGRQVRANPRARQGPVVSPCVSPRLRPGAAPAQLPRVPPELPPAEGPSLTETAAADATARQAADPHHAHGPVHTHCENCGTALAGPFCHRCGQHDIDVHRSFGHMALEALENLFHWDGKFLRNIVTLLFRPGALTAEFNAGKRAAQMPPFRLYIFTAFFFFLWAFSNKGELQPIEIGQQARPPHRLQVNHQPATVGQAIDALREESAPVPAPAKTAERNKPHLTIVPLDKPEAQKSDFERWVEHQAQRSTEPEFQREMAHVFLAAVPKLLLLCLPLFALYTRVFFRGSGQLYLQHLIIALHFHTFLFLWIMFRDGWVGLVNLPGWKLGGPVEFAANAWLALYPLLMLRRLFGQGWLRTIAKTIALTLAYCLTLAVVFFVSFLVIVLFL